MLKQRGWFLQGHDSRGSSETVLWLAHHPIMPLLIFSETANGLAAILAASGCNLAAINGLKQSPKAVWIFQSSSQKTPAGCYCSMSGKRQR